MLAWENSGFSVDASVRITLLDRDVPRYFESLEHLLRYCAGPPFALERLSVTRDASGRIARIRHVLPRHWITIWAANWIGPGRKRKSTQPRTTRCGRPSRRSPSGTSGSSAIQRPAGMRVTDTAQKAAAAPMCQADSAGGGGVSTAVPGVRRRHPADLVHHGAGPDPEDPHPPRRTARTAAALARQRAAHRLATRTGSTWVAPASLWRTAPSRG
jgi:hypothetical protein